MKNLSRIIMVAALLGGTLLLGSCTKSEFGQAGKLIQFGARADGASTKTAYAGKDNDAEGIEPIWWMQDDEVVIASPQAVVTNSNGKHQSTYKFKAYTSDNSHASVVNKGSNGLAWLDEDPDGGYDFYAVYGEGISVSGENEGMVNGTIPSPQRVEAHKYDATKTGSGSAASWYYVGENNQYTVYEPEMKYALMTAATTGVKSTDNPVSLTFKPAFTAFEFTFESADPSVTINLSEFRMESVEKDADGNTYPSARTALSGTFTGAAGSRAFTPGTNAGYSVALSNVSDLGEIKSGAGKSFTIFAMPQNLTNLVVYFTDKDADGTSRTRSLRLNYSDKKNDQGGYINGENHGKPLTFQAGHKYRIRGLKLPGNQYQFFLTLDGVVQNWDVVKDADGNDYLPSVFTDQIQTTALTFDKSAYEMTDEYYNSDITASHTSKNNNYRTGAPVGDGRWQVRRLNTKDQYDCFTVTFRPTAPLGGYWRLDLHDNIFFDVYLVEKDGEFQEKETLYESGTPGRIMNQTVTLRVKPVWSNILDEQYASTDIGLYFDCYFSTTIDFDQILDANTEFQDIHGNGTYSYWLLTVDR